MRDLGDPIAWEALLLGLGVAFAALVAMAFTWRALRAQRASDGMSAGPPLALLGLSLLLIAGLLLATWALNLQGNLGM
ncbi:MAG: hypothetical protein M0R74_12630 [Dehalococcoidia bacterium]|nr:hypothetical protein [Dehalococcoidia bacterium]